MGTLSAEYDFRSDVHTGSSDAVDGLPDLVITITVTEFRVPDRDYARTERVKRHWLYIK